MQEEKGSGLFGALVITLLIGFTFCLACGFLEYITRDDHESGYNKGMMGERLSSSASSEEKKGYRLGRVHRRDYSYRTIYEHEQEISDGQQEVLNEMAW